MRCVISVCANPTNHPSAPCCRGWPPRRCRWSTCRPSNAHPPHDPPAELRALREAVAPTLLPPPEVADYDLVLALPLRIDQQPLPARLAITTRRTPDGGTAAWLRVDAELSQLGPVSIRLSGADRGPVAITLAARSGAADVLSAALPQLAADLERLGIGAGVRVIEEP